MRKKGQISTSMLVPGIMALVVAGFLLVMGLIMLDELLTDVADDAATTVNETITTIIEAGEYVADRGYCGFNNFAVSQAINESSGTFISSGNYTTGNGRQGIIYFTGDDPTFNNTNWNITYTYTYGGTEACLGANATIEGMGKFGDYIDLLVLGIVISIILGLILWGFARKTLR